MGRNREASTLLGWLKALPDEIIQVRPVLCVGYAWASMDAGELEAVEPWLQKAEWWLEQAAELDERPHPEALQMVVANEEELRRLPGLIAIYRAGRAQLLGNVANTLKYARQVLEIVPEEDHLGRGAGTALLGLALWASGDLETAYRLYATGMARVQQAGNISDVISSNVFLADLLIAQGRLREAIKTYEQGLHFAMQQGAQLLRGTPDLYIGLSELLREQGDLDSAVQQLLKSKELSERTGLPQNRYRWSVAMARIREAQADLVGALDLLNEAERLYVRDFLPNVRPIAAMKTRVWIAQGRLEEARGWARKQGLAVEDDLSYLREFEHITLARVLLAHYQRDHADRTLLEAMGLLERLLKAADEGKRMGSVIEILLLQALAHYFHKDIPAALVPLQQALMLAEPEGYLRIFVDEGDPMAQLLREASARGIMPTYTLKLLTAFDGEQLGSAGKLPLPTAPTSQHLVEPLSERELEVLRLFKTELSGPEIARELVIALSTVRSHAKGIYSKLNVNSRREAVKRAAELHLI
jgi:LuxR family maltose regulon positive regulatory protein